MPVVIEDNKYCVRIHWENYDQSWNEVCAIAIDHFGMPGDKFSTDVTPDYMDFCFNEESDAIWFSLKVE